MLLKVDLNSSVPVYAQIITQIKHAIASGILRTGEFLPSLRDTARELRVNPHTVAKAYRELEVMGLVRTDQGRGSYVSDGARLSEDYRREQLGRLAEQFVVEGYHLGATPEEILETVGEKLTGILHEFDIRGKIGTEESND